MIRSKIKIYVFLGIAATAMVRLQAAAQSRAVGCSAVRSDITDSQLGEFVLHLKSGVKQVRIETKSSGNTEASRPNDPVTVRFDDNGRVTESYKEDSHVRHGRTVYAYDTKGRLIKKTDFFGSETKPWVESRYTYDDRGGLLRYEVRKVDETEKFNVVSRFSYDDAGRATHYQNDLIEYVSSIKQRDDQCRPLEIYKVDRNGAFKARETLKYDSKGNPVELDEYVENGASEFRLNKNTFEYEYDKNGNWTTRKTYSWLYGPTPTPVLLKEEVRTITYK